MIMETTTFLLLLAAVLSACAPVVTSTPAAIPNQDPKALAAELDDLVLANNQASTFDGAVLVVRITLEAIAEKLFGNGKQ
jgi:hypothetical protein